jgi:hypothetical protein
VSWHQDEHTLVLSLWQFGQCRATFRLPSDQVPELVRALVAGLSDGLAAQQRNAPPSSGGPQTPIRRTKAPTTGGAAEDGPTALVAVEPPTVPVDFEPPTVAVAAEPADGESPTAPLAPAPPIDAGPSAAPVAAESPAGPTDGEREIPEPPRGAERSAAPAAIFLAPPAQA